MSRLARFLRRAGRIASIGLLALFLALWMRSYRYWEVFSYYMRPDSPARYDGRGIDFSSAGGLLSVTISYSVQDAPALSPSEAAIPWKQNANHGVYPLRSSDQPLMPLDARAWQKRLGFSLRAGRTLSQYIGSVGMPPGITFTPPKGMSQPSRTITLSYRYVALTVPFWLPVTLLALRPTLSAARLFRKHRRLRQGKCARCGYDLRQTKERCPECGTAVPSERIAHN